MRNAAEARWSGIVGDAFIASAALPGHRASRYRDALAAILAAIMVMVTVTVTVVHPVMTVVVVPVMAVVALAHNKNSAAIGTHNSGVTAMMIVSVTVVVVKGKG
jgi:hypothetical protein